MTSWPEFALNSFFNHEKKPWPSVKGHVITMKEARCECVCVLRPEACAATNEIKLPVFDEVKKSQIWAEWNEFQARLVSQNE